MPRITIARLLPHEGPSRKFALMPTKAALRATADVLKKCFIDSDREEYEKLRGLLNDLEHLNGADAAHALVDLKKTTLFFLEFGLAIHGLRLKRA